MQKSFIDEIDRSIAHYMVDQGITQEQMAERMKLAANTLSWKRRGIREWKLSEIELLSDLTGLGLDDLTGRNFPEAQEPVKA